MPSYSGSDTSASTLTFIFDYLIQYPDWAKVSHRPHVSLLDADPYLSQRLRDEVDAHHRGHGDFDLEEMPVLHAVVNETLRLRPPVPGRSQRIVPDGGVTLCGQCRHIVFSSFPLNIKVHSCRQIYPPALSLASLKA